MQKSKVIPYSNHTANYLNIKSFSAHSHALSSLRSMSSRIIASSGHTKVGHMAKNSMKLNMKMSMIDISRHLTTTLILKSSCPIRMVLLYLPR